MISLIGAVVSLRTSIVIKFNQVVYNIAPLRSDMTRIPKTRVKNEMPNSFEQLINTICTPI